MFFHFFRNMYKQEIQIKTNFQLKNIFLLKVVFSTKKKERNTNLDASEQNRGIKIWFSGRERKRDVSCDFRRGREEYTKGRFFLSEFAICNLHI